MMKIRRPERPRREGWRTPARRTVAGRVMAGLSYEQISFGFCFHQVLRVFVAHVDGMPRVCYLLIIQGWQSSRNLYLAKCIKVFLWPFSFSNSTDFQNLVTQYFCNVLKQVAISVFFSEKKIRKIIATFCNPEPGIQYSHPGIIKFLNFSSTDFKVYLIVLKTKKNATLTLFYLQNCQVFDLQNLQNAPISLISSISRMCTAR